MGGTWIITVACLCASLSPGLSLPKPSDRPYEGHQVLDITTGNELHKNVIDQLVDEHELDVWRYPKSFGDTMSVRVRPEYMSRVLSTLTKHGLYYKINVRNVQDLVDEESLSMKNRSKRATRFDLNQYNSHKDINAFIQGLASGCSFCKVTNIGKSLQGRTMDVITISSGPGKKAIFIDGGIHAREWISPATVVNIANALVNDPAYKSMVDQFDWHILAVLNPDGYEYSRTTTRMWRKTRSRTENSGCYGTDGNRNWGYKWGGAGASTNPCSDTFRGTYAFSEMETINTRDFINQHKGNIVSYLTVHSYGQYLLYPWGYECQQSGPDDDALLKQAGNAAAAAIYSASGNRRTRYSVGTSACLLYPASGGSDDWAKGSANIPYSYTVELPDTGRYGFILPESHIRPVYIETMAGLKAFAAHIH